MSCRVLLAILQPASRRCTGAGAPDRRRPLKRKVLIVDDESDIVEFVQYNLRKEMYDTLAAGDGPKALQMARQHHPDLVLLDLMIPGIDGLEVCRVLKAGRDTAHIPIIMLTAKGEETDVVTGLEIGADDYVAKPFSMRLLLARMKAVLRRTGHVEEPQTGSIVKAHGLAIDNDRHQVTYRDHPVPLTLTVIWSTLYGTAVAVLDKRVGGLP